MRVYGIIAIQDLDKSNEVFMVDGCDVDALARYGHVTKDFEFGGPEIYNDTEVLGKILEVVKITTQDQATTPEILECVRESRGVPFVMVLCDIDATKTDPILLPLLSFAVGGTCLEKTTEAEVAPFRLGSLSVALPQLPITYLKKTRLTRLTLTTRPAHLAYRVRVST